MTEGDVRKFKVVFVGDSRCGKTALLSTFARRNFPEVLFHLRCLFCDCHTETRLYATGLLREYVFLRLYTKCDPLKHFREFSTIIFPAVLNDFRVLVCRIMNRRYSTATPRRSTSKETKWSFHFGILQVNSLLSRGRNPVEKSANAAREVPMQIGL